MVDRVALPYSLGVYLAVNAIPDARLVVDGPTCAFYRTDVIQGNHDLLAELFDVAGSHRVVNTAAEPDTVVMGRGEVLRRLLRRSAADPFVATTFILALPMSFLTGVSYEQLVAEAVGEDPRVHLLPRESLRADWLRGYADTLSAVASRLPLVAGEKDPHEVAVVGLLFDRNEGDQTGNVAELERLLGAMGLSPVSVWLAGRPYAHLAAAASAGTVVSLPHGREAARVVAARSGARLVELDLPVGLDGSARWLRQLGAAIGAEERAEALITDELRRVAPALRTAVVHGFQGSRFVVAAEPSFAAALGDFLRQLGGELLATYSTAGEGTQLDAIADDLARFQKDAPVDLFVGTAYQVCVAKARGVPFLELGFPCHTEHALRPRPLLGFEGAVALVEQIYNRVQLFRYLQA